MKRKCQTKVVGAEPGLYSWVQTKYWTFDSKCALSSHFCLFWRTGEGRCEPELLDIAGKPQIFGQLQNMRFSKNLEKRGCPWSLEGFCIPSEEYVYHIPNPKYTPKYTRQRYHVPKINMHSWASLQSSAAALLMLTGQSIYVDTHLLPTG